MNAQQGRNWFADVGASALSGAAKAVTSTLADDVSPSTVPEAQGVEAAKEALRIADEMRTAVEESKPGTPLKEMPEGEAYNTLREKLGITEEKLAGIRADVEAGKIGKEDVADLLHFNPSKFDWSMANDAESQVALMNTFTRVFADALGKAGTGRVSMESIYAQANKIGANVDQAIGLWKRLQGVEAGVRAQQFTVAASGAHLDRLAKKVASGNYTPQEMLDFVVHERRHALLQVTAQGSRSMIGRALRVMREGVQVNEAALKLSNGRRMRAERKARDLAAKTEALAKAVKEARALLPAKQAEAQQAREAANVAAVRREEAAAYVERSEAQLAAIARKFLDKVHKARLEAEQREAVRAAKEAVKQAEKAAQAAEALARKAEAEAAKYADMQDARFGVQPGQADVILTGDVKMQFDEVDEALAQLRLKSGEVVDLAREIAQRGAVAKRSPAQVGFWMQTQERLAFLYVNNILSGLPTMAINVSSGFLKMIESTLEHYGSAALAKIRGDKYAILAANRAAVATWTSWRAAWKVASEAWKEGLPQTDVLARAEVAARGGSGESAIAKAIALPSRSILTIDEFFKHIFYHQELNARAVEVAASAAQLQHSPLAQQRMFETVLKETMENPPDDLVLDAIEAARYQTFQGSLQSKMANNLARMTNESPLFKLAVPFIRTPLNIVKQGIVERTPLALLRKSVRDDILAGTREGNTAAIRIALGTALIGTVWNWADEGRITGARAGFGRNRNTGDIENIPPYSIKIGERWYQYNRLDPWGTPLGLVADLRAAYAARNERNTNALTSDDEELSEGFGNALAILSKNLLDKTFFKGISDLTSAIDEGRSDGGAIGRYLQNLGSNLVPFSSFVRNVAKSHDEYAREAFTFSDKLIAQTPGLSKELPPRRDILGRPIPNAERLGPSWLSPFLVGQDDPDPVARELATLSMNYSMPDKNIAGVYLSAKQYSRLLEVRGEFLHERMSTWMNSAEWAKLSKYQKIEHVRRFLSAGTSRATTAVMDEWPELGEQVRGLKFEARALKAGALQ